MSSITVGGNVVDAGGRGPQGPPGAATPATTSTLGAVIVGDNLTVDETGRVSAPAQTGGVPEAPNDGSTYGRHADGWIGVVPEAAVGVAGGVAALDQTGKVPAGQLPTSSSGVAEAPLTSLSYVRNNGAWVPKDKVVLNWFWAAVDAAMSGGIPAKLVVLGDSNTVGQGAGDSGAALLTNARPYSSTQQLVDLLIAEGIHVTSDSFFGDQNIYTTGGAAGVELYDPRISIGTGWIAADPANTLGGAFYQAGGEVAGALGFTPANEWDQCDVYYVAVPGGATEIDVYQGATKIGSYSCAAGAVGVAKATFTGSLQSAQLQFKQTAGGSGSAFVIGAVCRNTALPSLEVYQCGWGGATIANLADTSTTYTPTAVLALVSPNLTIFQCTVNDVTGGTTPTDYAAGLAQVATVALSSGDLMMVSGFPGNAVGTTGGPEYAPLYDNYKRLMENTVLSSGGFVTDFREIFGNTWAVANSRNLVFDSYHPNRTAYAIEAARWNAIIMSARG